MGLICYLASSQVGIKGDKMKLYVSQKGNNFSSEDLSLHDYFSSLLLLPENRYSPCTVRLSLPVIHTRIFPFTTSFAKNVGSSLCRWSSCAQWDWQYPLFFLDIKCANKHLALRKWSPLNLFSVCLQSGCYLMLKIESLWSLYGFLKVFVTQMSIHIFLFFPLSILQAI